MAFDLSQLPPERIQRFEAIYNQPDITWELTTEQERRVKAIVHQRWNVVMHRDDQGGHFATIPEIPISSFVGEASEEVAQQSLYTNLGMVAQHLVVLEIEDVLPEPQGSPEHGPGRQPV